MNVPGKFPSQYISAPAKLSSFPHMAPTGPPVFAMTYAIEVFQFRQYHIDVHDGGDPCDHHRRSLPSPVVARPRPVQSAHQRDQTRPNTKQRGGLLCERGRRRSYKQETERQSGAPSAGGRHDEDEPCSYQSLERLHHVVTTEC